MLIGVVPAVGIFARGQSVYRTSSLVRSPPRHYPTETELRAAPRARQRQPYPSNRCSTRVCSFSTAKSQSEKEREEAIQRRRGRSSRKERQAEAASVFARTEKRKKKAGSCRARSRSPAWDAQVAREWFGSARCVGTGNFSSFPRPWLSSLQARGSGPPPLRASSPPPPWPSPPAARSGAATRSDCIPPLAPLAAIGISPTIKAKSPPLCRHSESDRRPTPSWCSVLLLSSVLLLDLRVFCYRLGVDIKCCATSCVDRRSSSVQHDPRTNLSGNGATPAHLENLPVQKGNYL